MSGLIDNLISLLESQIENYDDLLGLSLEKKDVIIKNDLEYLQKITSLENILVGKNQKLEKKRAQLIQDVAIVLNKEPEALTLSTLAKLLNGQPEHKNFVEVSNRIRDVVEKLKTTNEQNRILINNSLEYIDFSMNLIRSSLSKEPAYYTTGGEEVNNSKNVFFDAKQ